MLNPPRQRTELRANDASAHIPRHSRKQKSTAHLGDGDEAREVMRVALVVAPVDHAADVEQLRAAVNLGPKPVLHVHRWLAFSRRYTRRAAVPSASS